VAITEVDAADWPHQLSGLEAFFDHYRDQLFLHHVHEDTVFSPALRARVGASTMRLVEIAGQHEALDVDAKCISDEFARLTDPAGDIAAGRGRLGNAVAAMMEGLAAHLDLEEKVGFPLLESNMPFDEYRMLEAAARRETARVQAQFLIPWIVAHATPDERKALFRSAPPMRVVYWLNRQRYRRLDEALVAEQHRSRLRHAS
jgi:iron-sulfur cluster repair protein YtfE (RIC family)